MLENRTPTYPELINLLTVYTFEQQALVELALRGKTRKDAPQLAGEWREFARARAVQVAYLRHKAALDLADLMEPDAVMGTDTIHYTAEEARKYVPKLRSDYLPFPVIDDEPEDFDTSQ